MDQQEKIEALVSENELLQLELNNLRITLKQKDQEINLLGESFETVASLQSRIDNNLLEIEQLKYNNGQASEKTAAVESVNEQLEVDLLRTIKEKQQKETMLKSLGSVKTELDIVSGELEESALLYKKLSVLEDQLAEANSRNDLLQVENDDLRSAKQELESLINLMKKQKFD